MTYEGDSGKVEVVNGLALNPDGTKLAIYAFDKEGNTSEIWNIYYPSYLWLVNSSDGM